MAEVEVKDLRVGDNRDTVEVDVDVRTRTHVVSAFSDRRFCRQAKKIRRLRRQTTCGRGRSKEGTKVVYRARKRPLYLAHTCRTSRICQHSIRAVSVVLLSTSSSRKHVVIAYIIDVIVTNSSSKHTM